MKYFVAFVTFLSLLLPSANAEETTRILFIGNSYTGQIRKTVSKFIEASPEGNSTEMEFISPGGKTLDFHLKTQATIQKIADGNWDFVVLQDQSQTPAVFPEQFEAAAVKLDKLIDAAGAKTVFYQTWGRRDGDKNPGITTYESMQKKLSKGYESVAKRCNAILAPVGDTWSRVRKADPKLGKALYKADGSHPSDHGAYLGACVFYSTFFNTTPNTDSFKSTLTNEEIATIVSVLQPIVTKAEQPKSDAVDGNGTIATASHPALFHTAGLPFFSGCY